MPSVFSNLDMKAPDAIFAIATRYKQDPFPKKVDLSIGAYRTDEAEPYIFDVVREAEKLNVAESTEKEYLPITGLESFKDAAQTVIFGYDFPLIKEKRIATVQTLSGTGALRIAADLIRKAQPDMKTIYISNPAWPNYRNLFEAAGFNIQLYYYWNKEKLDYDFDKALSDIIAIREPSVIVLQVSGHNPTGCDFTKGDWQKLLDALSSTNHVILFDLAYQGFVTGNLDNDSFPLKKFAEMGKEFLVCQSFAKIMGLYGERVGALHVVCRDTNIKDIVLSQLESIIRSQFSSAPLSGTKIANRILNTPSMRKQWEEELKNVVLRLRKVRKLIYDKLIEKHVPGKWEHIIKQQGMFSYTGLSPEQCNYMIDKWHVYILPSGRISVAGLTEGNVDYVADAIHDAVLKFK